LNIGVGFAGENEIAGGGKNAADHRRGRLDLPGDPARDSTSDRTGTRRAQAVETREDYLARSVAALVLECLDPCEIEGVCVSERGQPRFDPAMVTALLLCAYCCGVYSLRWIGGRRRRERVDFMSLEGRNAKLFWPAHLYI
jgi:hypothetical protein